MAVTIRTIREDETRNWLEAVSAGMFEHMDATKVAEEVRPLWDFNRVWGAFEAGAVVGTLRTFASELTLPGGGRLPASSVAGVAVRATHRRRGILRQLMAVEHAAARERGEALAILHAMEYPIYGRFGYGPATLSATWTLDAMATEFRGSPAGSVELATASPEARDAIKGVFEAWRLRQPGEISRRESTWDYDLGLRESAWGPRWNGDLAFHRDRAGRLDGYVRYRVEDKWVARQPRYALTVNELHALTDDAYAALWQYLASVDLVATIKAERRAPAERLPWLLTNGRAAEPSEIGDELWVKLLDVPRALGGRAYERQARIVLEVIDGTGTDAKTRTRVALDASPAGSTCTITDRDADLTLEAAALGAAYLGGARLRDAVVTHGFDEHRRDALATADALFATLDAPWCSTFF